MKLNAVQVQVWVSRNRDREAHGRILTHVTNTAFIHQRHTIAKGYGEQ